MKLFSMLLALGLILSACTNTITASIPSPTETPIPSETPTPSPIASYPSGAKWYVDTGEIRALTFDKDGNLWTGGAGVIYKWDLGKNTYEGFELTGNTMPIDIHSMVTDKNGILWVGAEYGLWKYEDESFTKEFGFDYYQPTVSLTPAGDVVVYLHKSFYLFENNYWKEYHTEHPIESLAVDKNGFVWVTLFERGEGGGKNWGVARFDGETWKPIPEFSNTKGAYWTKVCGDNIWFFSPGWLDLSLPIQIIKYDGMEWKNYPQQTMLGTNIISLVCDQENNLQIYTHKGIMSLLNDQLITKPLPQLSGTGSLAIDKSGNYCLGTNNGVLCENNGKWNSYLVPGLPEWGVLSLAIAPDNNVWFGTLDGGAIHFNGKDWKIYTTEAGLPSNWVNDIKIDHNGDVWFATTEGLARFDGQNWSTYTSADGLIPYSIYTIWIDKDNSMWVGGLMGVSFWDGKTWHSFSRDFFPITETLSIDVSPDGTVWFGTEDGLVRFDGTNWKSFVREDGLPNTWIYGLAAASNNDIWIRTSGGLTYFDGLNMNTIDYQELPILSGAISMLDDCTFLVPEGVVKVFNNKPSLFTWKNYNFPSTPNVNSINLAPDNSVWLATFEGALRLSKEIIPNVAFTGCN